MANYIDKRKVRKVRKVLINASYPGETRIAEIEMQNNKQKLYNLTIKDKTDIQDNIYLGTVAHIDDQTNAAHIDIGEDKNGFLKIKNLSSELLDRVPPDANSETRMSEILDRGEELIVQVRMGARPSEGKGAELTCIIDLPGIGMRRRSKAPKLEITPSKTVKDRDRDMQYKISKQMESIIKPDDADIIEHQTVLRMTEGAIQAEVNELSSIWDKIVSVAKDAKAPCLLRPKPKLTWMIIRNYRLNRNKGQILVDDEELYQQLKDLEKEILPKMTWGKHSTPENRNKMKLYSEPTPIFSHFDIAEQVANTFQRHVKLPSGGSIVINPTEALTCIDVNLGQGKKGNMEKTAVTTNKKALAEIVRQLRLRDIGGQIVIDLSQMESADNREQVLQTIRESGLIPDDDIHKSSNIFNEFGLLSMTLKKRLSMADKFMGLCSHCQGSGSTATSAAMSSLILRKVENEFAKGNGEANRSGKGGGSEHSSTILKETDYKQFKIFVPVEVSVYLMNHLRDTIAALEARHGVSLAIEPNPELNWPDFKIDKFMVNPLEYSDKPQDSTEPQTLNDRKILINTSFPSETRIAEIEKQNLCDLTIEQRDKTDIQGNIYLGKVVDIDNQLNAARVDIGEIKNGFLPYENLSPALLNQRTSATSSETRMSKILKVEEELIVQVPIDKRHNEEKEAELTCIINLPGLGLALKPNAPKHGISIHGKLSEDEKQRCLEYLSPISKPDDAGIIVHETGLEMTLEEMQAEINALNAIWNKVILAAKDANAPCLLLQKPELPWRIVRDYLLDPNIGQILVDDEELYQELKSWGKYIRPENSDKIKLYSEQTPIFSHFGIAQQVANTFLRKVELPSGGNIVIDHTETLTCIDVNSGNTKKTVVTTNTEALTETARQLRLRDIGGQIVIDLIDMKSEDNQIRVRSEFCKSMSVDPAKTKINYIKEFDLLFLTRERLRATMSDSFMVPCSHCQGIGRLATPAAMSSLILREVQNKFAEGNGAANRSGKGNGSTNFKGTNYEQFQIFVPVEVSVCLMDHKRETITTLEVRHGVNLTIVPSPALNIPNFKIRKSIKHTDNVKPIKHSDKQQDFNYRQTLKTQRKALVDSKPSYSRADRRRRLINKLLQLFRIGRARGSKSIIVMTGLKNANGNADLSQSAGKETAEPKKTSDTSAPASRVPNDPRNNSSADPDGNGNADLSQSGGKEAAEPKKTSDTSAPTSRMPNDPRHNSSADPDGNGNADLSQSGGKETAKPKKTSDTSAPASRVPNDPRNDSSADPDGNGNADLSQSGGKEAAEPKKTSDTSAPTSRMPNDPRHNSSADPDGNGNADLSQSGGKETAEPKKTSDTSAPTSRVPNDPRNDSSAYPDGNGNADLSQSGGKEATEPKKISDTSAPTSRVPNDPRHNSSADPDGNGNADLSQSGGKEAAEPKKTSDTSAPTSRVPNDPRNNSSADPDGNGNADLSQSSGKEAAEPKKTSDTSAPASRVPNDPRHNSSADPDGNGNADLSQSGGKETAEPKKTSDTSTPTSRVPNDPRHNSSADPDGNGNADLSQSGGKEAAEPKKTSDTSAPTSRVPNDPRNNSSADPDGNGNADLSQSGGKETAEPKKTSDTSAPASRVPNDPRNTC